jgi:hypothetical protein
MRKVAALAAVLTIGLGTVTACSDDGGDYCSELRNYADAAKGLDIKDSKAVDKMLDKAEKVSDAAPDDLKDDWKVVLDYANKAKDAGGDQKKLTELAKNDGQKIAGSMEAITKHAKDTCKVDVNG